MSATTLARIDDAVFTVTVTHPNRATIAETRTWLTDYLARRGHKGDAADSAVLILSELATNAVLHAAGPIAVSAHLPGDLLTLTVSDRPTPQPSRDEDPYETDEHGRGLFIIAALAQSLAETTRAGRHAVTVAIPLGDPDIPGYGETDHYPAI